VPKYRIPAEAGVPVVKPKFTKGESPKSWLIAGTYIELEVEKEHKELETEEAIKLGVEKLE